MWSDKETTEDLLGYTVHASLLKSVVTNDKNLPITVGLYGDWGSGKTSILKILEEELKMIMIPSWFILTVGRLRVSTMPRWH